MSQSHMVVFQAPDGSQEFRQFESIDQVVTFVEDLRNSSGLDSAKIYRLEEVRFEFRPYYRVQMAAGGAPVVAGTDRGSDLGPEASSGSAQPSSVSVAPTLAAVPDPQPSAPEPIAVAPMAPPPSLTSIDSVPAPAGRSQVAQPIAEPAPVPGPDRQAIADQLAETVEFTPSFTDEGFRQAPQSGVETEPTLGMQPAPASSVVAPADDAAALSAPSASAPTGSRLEATDEPGPDAVELDSSAQRFTSTAFGIDPPATTRRGLFGR